MNHKSSSVRAVFGRVHPSEMRRTLVTSVRVHPTVSEFGDVLMRSQTEVGVLRCPAGNHTLQAEAD